MTDGHKQDVLKKCGRGEASIGIQYIYNIGLVLSQVLSTILGGDPDETVSSRTGKAARQGERWFLYIQEPFINFLFQDEKHCENAIEEEEGCKEIWHWS